MNSIRLITLGLAAAVAGAVATSPVLAQKAGTTPPTTTAPAKKTTAKAATAAPAKAKKSVRSACAGLAEKVCTANKECGWVKYKKTVSKSGRKLTPHCRKLAGVALKKK